MQHTENSFQATYESTYVAFLDILGFKQRVLSNSHEHLESFYLGTLRGNLEHALSNGKYVSVNSGGDEWFGPDIRQATVNSLLVSDSIVLWTDDSGPGSFVHLVSAVRNLLAFSVIDSILLRGAISVGSLTVVLNQWPSKTHSFQHTLFGKALVDAVEAEKVQEWVGCRVTDDAMERYKTGRVGSSSLLENTVIVRYAIPSSKGAEVEGYAVDWVNHQQARIDFESVTGAFTPSPGTDPQEFDKIQRKLVNTLKFVKHVKPSADQPRVLGQFLY